MKYIDLTHSFTENMPVYPGDPSPALVQVADINKEGYTDHQITTVMHVGTHMDAPLHMIPQGKHMDEMSIDKFIGPGVVIDARGKKEIHAGLLEGMAIPQGSIVLVYTGFGNKYNSSEYFENYPSITEDFAQRMVELKVNIVGMDILGPDQPPFPTHKILLAHEILIIENLAHLDDLLTSNNFEVIALPMKLHADAAPVRVIAKIIE